MLTHFSLFTGIGGIDLAAEWAGFKTVGQCEFADYPTKVLEKHWPDVPRWKDVRDVTAESFEERTGRTTVDLVSGGFPCQPFSVAGEQRGEDDDRYLWPEMLRVISELKPTWVLGENVTGIISMALDNVLAELECVGYEVQPIVIPAAGVNAPHRRERVFILAHSRNRGRGNCERGSIGGNGERKLDKAEWSSASTSAAGSSKASETVAHTDSRGLQGCGETGNTCGKWWSTEPGVGRVAHGVPNRSHRLKCLGNAVVPQQVFPILQAIAEIESSTQLSDIAKER